MIAAQAAQDVEHFHSFRPAGHYGVPGCVRIALEGLWGYWLTYRKLSENYPCPTAPVARPGICRFLLNKIKKISQVPAPCPIASRDLSHMSDGLSIAGLGSSWKQIGGI